MNGEEYEGWARTRQGERLHYFRHGRSLCGRRRATLLTDNDFYEPGAGADCQDCRAGLNLTPSAS